jgi:SNF2 family DNA or RNA helicase
MEFIADMDAWYLAMDMGTGKTLVAINLILEQDPEMVLIVSPKTVMDVWVDEFRRHAPTYPKVMTVLRKGSTKDKTKQCQEALEQARALGVPLIVAVNYESVWRGTLGKWTLNQNWDIVIGDEGHRIKAPGGKASRFFARLASQSGVRGLLSGTPLPNNRLDAYGQFRFLDSQVFGTIFARFRARYAEVVTYKGFPEIVGWRNEEEFNRKLAALMYRVDSDVLELPPLSHVRRTVRLPPKARKVYTDLEKKFVADVGEEQVTVANALVRLLRLQQVTSGQVTDDMGVMQVLHSEKEAMLYDIIEGIKPEDPVVVFCRFTADVEAVRRVAAKLGRQYGEVSGRATDLDGGRIRAGDSVLGVQIRSGGVGVNLSASRYAIFYSVGFGLADYLQALKRLHRGGQDHPVTYYHLVAVDSVDELVYTALSEKRKVVEEILNYVKMKGATHGS